MKNGKSKGPDDISTDLIKLGRKAILPYLIRIFHVSLNNSKVPENWKLAFVVPIFKSGDKTKLCNYRPVSLTSVVCKLMEHLVGSYIKKEWKLKMALRWATRVQEWVLMRKLSSHAISGSSR